MPFPVALLCHPAGAYVFLVIAVAGLVHGVGMRRFVPAFAGVSAALLTSLAFLHVPPNVAGLASLALGVLLLHAEFLLPTYGVAGALGLIASAGGSWLLLAPTAPGVLVPPLWRLLLALAGTFAILAVVARTTRLRTLPR
jgi:membrane-bound serine protease (ClpP class)